MTRSTTLARQVLIPIVLLATLFAGHPSAGAQAAVSPWLEAAIRQGRSDTRHTVWIYFRDKGPARVGTAGAATVGTDRARARRSVRGRASETSAFEDRPVDAGYVNSIARMVLRVRQQSRWLNAVSVEATAAQVASMADLPFVARVDIVRRYRRVRDEDIEAFTPRARPRTTTDEEPSPAAIDYGPSLDQLAQLRVPELHQRGLTGEGVVVAVFDSGFPNLAHEAFASMKIAAERDFVDSRETVRETFSSHGTNTLSTLGGYSSGRLIGPAYGATFLLAVTENVLSETPLEEDNWAAAAEWAEALGADVVSSSLGYFDFDRPFTGYTDRDMDGETAVTTKAASMLAARGVVVVNSAGNAGFDPARNTLGAPADGKLVVTVGAVDRNGLRASFSSVGPTADGRIKPDVVALGVRAVVASAQNPQAYGFASGTSFSCPLTAGVVALLLQAHPKYSVPQVLDALRSTASRASEPDTLLGWGIVDAVRAVDLELPVPATTGSSASSVRPRF